MAVLPFISLSDDPANAYFADGVQDEILTDLAKVADLKVISRTSVVQYKSTETRNLREIAAQLGVANVLEGSVQRVGNTVRVTAQLIDARTDTHLWARALRPTAQRCVRHPKRHRAGNRAGVASASFAAGKGGYERAADRRFPSL